MRNLLPFAIAFGLVGTASAQNTSSTVQSGSGHTISIVQNPFMNDASVDQSGLDNIADILQTGANVAEVEQGGTADNADIDQDGTGNEAVALLSTFFTGGGDIDAVINQLGNDNFGRVFNDGVNVDATINQTGDNNLADVVSGLNSADVDILATVDQLGNGNAAFVGQTGTNQLSTIVQTGDDNTADVSQSGDSNVSTIDQTDTNHLAITSDGGSNQIGTITQSGDANQARTQLGTFFGANNDGTHLATGHQRRGGRVDDEARGDAHADQLPGGESGTLEPRACFGAEHGGALPRLPRRTDHTEGGPVSGCRERAGVAVGEDAFERT